MTSFTCAVCNETFDSAWTDEEAREECRQLWGPTTSEFLSEVCDGCFKMFMDWYRSSEGQEICAAIDAKNN